MHPPSSRRPRAALQRRDFLRWLAASPLSASLLASGCRGPDPAARGRAHRLEAPSDPGSARNVFDLEAAGRAVMGRDASEYLAGGADDLRTVRANREAFERVLLRPRRLVDVSRIDTTLTLFGQSLRSPILLAPVGFQQFFHPEGERATARAADRRGHVLIVSSASNASIQEVADSSSVAPWFQLYPTPDRRITQGLLDRAEAAGCPVLVLTVDTPEIGNREMHASTLQELLRAGKLPMGSYAGLRDGEPINDPSMTWDMIGWLRQRTPMKVVVKGIVTHEDAALAVDHGADGIIVSNHGGRQLDSGRATLDCLPEVVAAVDGRLPVLLDGGIRRGTDVLKALAWGARAVCIGRPYCWGLGAFGQAGVERCLQILQRELILDLQLCGCPSLQRILPAHATRG